MDCECRREAEVLLCLAMLYQVFPSLQVIARSHLRALSTKTPSILHVCCNARNCPSPLPGDVIEMVTKSIVSVSEIQERHSPRHGTEARPKE